MQVSRKGNSGAIFSTEKCRWNNYNRDIFRTSIGYTNETRNDKQFHNSECCCRVGRNLDCLYILFLESVTLLLFSITLLWRYVN